jgi:hypothetical protein
MLKMGGPSGPEAQNEDRAQLMQPLTPGKEPGTAQKGGLGPCPCVIPPFIHLTHGEPCRDSEHCPSLLT